MSWKMPAPRLLVERRCLAGEQLRAPEDRRDRRAQLVRQDADERLADGLAAARLGHVAHHDDRLLAGGREADPDGDRVGRDLDPAIRIRHGRQFDRPAGRAERGSDAVRIVQLVEDLGVGPLLDVGEQALAGRVRQRDRAVGRAHDDGLTHRPDDGVQLGRPGMLGLGQPLEADLDLDPLVDVAGDRDDRPRPVRQLDRPEDDLDRVAGRPSCGRYSSMTVEPSGPSLPRPSRMPPSRAASAGDSRSSTRDPTRSSRPRPSSSERRG